jgi:hypothetical protein
MRLARTGIEASSRRFCRGTVDVKDCDSGAFRREATSGGETDPTW